MKIKNRVQPITFEEFSSKCNAAGQSPRSFNITTGGFRFAASASDFWPTSAVGSKSRWPASGTRRSSGVPTTRSTRRSAGPDQGNYEADSGHATDPPARICLPMQLPQAGGHRRDWLH